MQRCTHRTAGAASGALGGIHSIPRLQIALLLLLVAIESFGRTTPRLVRSS